MHPDPFKTHLNRYPLNPRNKSRFGFLSFFRQALRHQMKTSIRVILKIIEESISATCPHNASLMPSKISLFKRVSRSTTHRAVKKWWVDQVLLQSIHSLKRTATKLTGPTQLSSKFWCLPNKTNKELRVCYKKFHVGAQVEAWLKSSRLCKLMRLNNLKKFQATTSLIPPSASRNTALQLTKQVESFSWKKQKNLVNSILRYRTEKEL